MIKTWEYITTDSDLKAAAKDIEDYKRIYRDKNKRPRFAFDTETYPDIEGIEDMSPAEVDKACESLGIRDYRPIKTLDGGYEAHTRLFQLGLDPKVEDVQFLFDARSLGSDQLAYYHKDTIEECLLIGHYLIYDMEYLVSDQYKLFPKYPRCTCIGPQLWLAGDNIDLDNPDPRKKQRYALYACYEKFLDWGWFQAYTGKDIREYVEFKLKHQASNWGAKILTTDQLQYAADDVRIVPWLYKAEMEYLDALVKKYNKPGLIETYKLTCEAIISFAIMGLVGLNVDIDQLDEVIRIFQEKIDTAEAKLIKLREFWRYQEKKYKGRKKDKSDAYTRRWNEFTNLNGKPYSKQDEEGNKVKERGQLLDALARLGITNLESTGREYLEQLVYDPEFNITDKQREVLEIVLDHKVGSYMQSKYGTNLKADIHSDGRFHPRVFQVGGKETVGGLDGGVDTQRTTIAYPPLQTLPADEEIGKAVRKVISKTPGKRLIVLDFNNQEVQIAAMLTKDPYLMKVFKESRDQHSETAKFVLRLDYFPKKGTDERKVGKTAYLAHQYQQGWKQFIHKTYVATKCKVKLSEKQARDVKDQLKEQYPGITKKITQCNFKVDKHLEDYESLRYFANRRPIFVAFTEMEYKFEDTGEKFNYTRIRNWCLNLEQEKIAKSVSKGTSPADDPLSRNYGKWNEEKQKYETWNNFFNSRVSEIKREYFNFLIQPEGATMLNLAMRDLYRAFKERYYDKGYSIQDVAIVLECHDEVVIECLEELVDEVAELATTIMTRIFRAIVKGLDKTAYAKPTTIFEIFDSENNLIETDFAAQSEAEERFKELGIVGHVKETPGINNWSQGK